jgi:hypothetical protein
MSKKLVHNGWIFDAKGNHVMHTNLYEGNIPEHLKRGKFYVLSERTIEKLYLPDVLSRPLSRPFLRKNNIATINNGVYTENSGWYKITHDTSQLNPEEVYEKSGKSATIMKLLLVILLIAMALYAIVHLLYR